MAKLSNIGWLAAIIFGFFAYWYLAPRNAPLGMFEGADESGTVRIIASFLATVAGVFLGSIYRELRRLQDAGTKQIDNASAFAIGMMRSVELWMGLAGSPIVYALLLKTSDGMSMSGLVITGLENGFCCLIILNTFLQKPQTTK
jgi:hypothetical protein